MIKCLLTAAVAPLLLSLPVIGSPSEVEVDEHISLIVAIESVGVEVSFNTKEHCLSGVGGSFVSGFYRGGEEPLLVVCQDKKRGRFDGEIVEATENDLDTIRHEAHHIVQDCSDGEIDGMLVPMFTGEARSRFLSGYSRERQEQVRELYAQHGASDYIITLEVEAFAVAETVSPSSIENAVKRLCQL